MKRRPEKNVRAECGWCGLTPPDENGQRDLLEHPDCPVHAPAREEDQS